MQIFNVWILIRPLKPAYIEIAHYTSIITASCTASQLLWNWNLKLPRRPYCVFLLIFFSFINSLPFLSIYLVFLNKCWKQHKLWYIRSRYILTHHRISFRTEYVNEWIPCYVWVDSVHISWLEKSNTKHHVLFSSLSLTSFVYLFFASKNHRYHIKTQNVLNRGRQTK